MINQFVVSINNFNGPLDLLLFMIKNKEIDILELNLLDLINQYVEFINNLEIDINAASDYIFTAAYLLEIKSNMILPKTTIEIDAKTPEDERKELVEKLLEYKKIKDIAARFKKIHDNEFGRISKTKSIFKPIEKNPNIKIQGSDVSIEKLSKVFLKLIEKANYDKPLETKVLKNNISTKEISDEMIRIISGRPDYKFKLSELLEYFDVNLKVLAACFVSILDMCSHQKILLEQKALVDDIYIAFNKECISNGN